LAKCISILKNEAAALDATQEIFMKLLLNLSKFSAKSKFSTWVYSISYNYCIDVVRKKKKQQNLLADIPQTKEDEEVEEISDAELLEVRIEQLEVILDKMNADDKIILLMKYQDEMSITEIAGNLQISESAVKMRIKRAKMKFKRIHESTFN
jgi:RNA polymerase sigma-70 factor (ECF subfamily)